jgi:hypothetical protein
MNQDLIYQAENKLMEARHALSKLKSRSPRYFNFDNRDPCASPPPDVLKSQAKLLQPLVTALLAREPYDEEMDEL